MGGWHMELIGPRHHRVTETYGKERTVNLSRALPTQLYYVRARGTVYEKITVTISRFESGLSCKIVLRRKVAD